MVKKGPPRLPLEVLIARGSRHARGRIREAVAAEAAKPQPTADIPERRAPHRPVWLTSPASKAWDELIPILSAMGVLSPADGGLLARYVTSLVEYISHDRTLREVGAWYDLPSGSRRLHPAVRLRADCGKILKSCEDSLGLNPSARSRLGLVLAWTPGQFPPPTPKPDGSASSATSTSDGERFFRAKSNPASPEPQPPN